MPDIFGRDDARAAYLNPPRDVVVVSDQDLADEITRATGAEQTNAEAISALSASRAANGFGVAFYTGSAWPTRPVGYKKVQWVGPASAGDPPIDSTHALDGIDEVVLT
jgi:hypothetical protein